MMVYRIFGLICLSLLVANCTTSKRWDVAKDEFRQEVAAVGSNPYIKEPVYKDLEARMIKIATADHKIINSAGEVVDQRGKFTPVNQAILGNFKSEYDHSELMRSIGLADKGFDGVVAELYPNVGSQTGCSISESAVKFYNFSEEPKPLTWSFVQGECEAGVANGVGEAADAANNARFVGLFEQGVMKKGVIEFENEEGERQLVVGGIPSELERARAILAYRDTDKDYPHTYVYGDQAASGDLDGFNMILWNRSEGLIVKRLGTYVQSSLNGFGASQEQRDFYDSDSKIWYAWLGQYKDGSLNGPGGWTDGYEDIEVGNWVDGKINEQGVSYGISTYFESRSVNVNYGYFVDGKLEGETEFVDYWNIADMDDYSGTRRVFRDGDVVSSKDFGETGGGFDFGQVVAIAGVGAVLGASGLPMEQMVGIGSAFAADVLGDTGGSNIAAMQANLASATGVTPTSTGISSSSGTSAGGPLNTYNYQLTCPDTGVKSTIPVPYRTEACRKAAMDFARTFACNMTDQERVTQQCISACGHPQCLQE